MCWCLQPSCWTWHAIWMESIPLHQNCLCASAFGSAMDWARRPGPKWEVLNSAALGYGFWTMFWPMDRMTWWDDPGPIWFDSVIFRDEAAPRARLSRWSTCQDLPGKLSCWSHGEALEFFKFGYYMMGLLYIYIWISYNNKHHINDGVFYMVFIII